MKSSRSRKPPFKKAPPTTSPLAIGFSRLDEIMASPALPFYEGRFRDRIALARAALGQARAEKCDLLAWATLCSVANELESAIALKFIDDPDGLLADSFAALRACAQRFPSADSVIGLPPGELDALSDMLDGWVAFLTEHSARRVVRALRHTDARVLALARGEIKMGDLVCSVTEGQSLTVEGAPDA